MSFREYLFRSYDLVYRIFSVNNYDVSAPHEYTVLLMVPYYGKVQYLL